MVLVIEIEVSVAAIFEELGVIDGTGAAFLFVGEFDEGTGKLLAVIAFVLVEPSSAIGHFQIGFTDQIAVFRELPIESFVSPAVEGNIGGGRVSGGLWRLFGIDVLIDLEGIVGGIRKKSF